MFPHISSCQFPVRVLIQLPSTGIVVARVRRGGVVGHRFGTFQGDGQLIRRNGIPGDPHFGANKKCPGSMDWFKGKFTGLSPMIFMGK